ncbi:MAG: glycosyltransferase [Pyrinomonadaceae bacterium]
MLHAVTTGALDLFMPRESKDDSRTNGQPAVSIGMPVYNGERYLRAAIDSLLAQDYSDFELTISDNASEDKTEAICREYAARDPRIRYYRAEKNMGAVWNFNRVFELSRGEYFMWAAFDDLRDPQYIEQCVNALEKHPAAVLCCTDVQVIDEEGREVDESIVSRGIRPIGATRRERVSALARAIFWYDIYGLIRSRALAQTRMALPVWGFDVILVLELCLLGEVIAIPKKLFLYRFFLKKTNEDLAKSIVPTIAEHRAASASWSFFALEMARSVWLAPLRFSEKIKLLWLLLTELCLGNPLVRRNIGHEKITAHLNEALRGKRYGLLAGLLSISSFVFLADTVNNVINIIRHNRVMDSARYRSGKAWKRLFHII